jgi:hypothetical protein
LRGHKACVVANRHAVADFFFFVLLEILRKGGGKCAHIGEGVIFGDNSAPAIGAKFNWRSCHVEFAPERLTTRLF